MRRLLILILVLFSLSTCKKETDNETIFQGYVRNRITNQSLANASVWIETEGGGGGIWIITPPKNSISMKNSLKMAKVDSSFSSVSTNMSTPISDISTHTDNNGYFRVKASTKVRYLTGSYFENDIMADFHLNDFKVNNTNEVNILVDCPAYFWPVLAPRGETQWTDSVCLWIVDNKGVVTDSQNMTSNGYLVSKTIAGGPIRAYNPCNPYADRSIKYKIGFLHENKWIYTIDSIYMKSFTRFVDTIKYNIK